MPEYTKQVQTGVNKAGPIYETQTFKYKKDSARIRKGAKGQGSGRPARTRSSLAIASLSGENNLYREVYGGQQSPDDIMKRQNQADMARRRENERQRRYSYYRGTLFRGKQERK